MTLHDARFDKAIEKIDAANSEDPHVEIEEGVACPKELLYSRRMSAWLDRLAPDASDAVRLAVRGQHLRRWESPRDAYPMDRPGYHRWRTDLYRFHAEHVGEILREVGYEEDFIGRVQSLVRKEGIKTNEEAQLLEDVICLVFLENYFSEFASRHEEEKMLTILRRTWKKMSARGHAAALKLPFTPEDLVLVQKALSDALN